jgi:hypothetical protein
MSALYSSGNVQIASYGLPIAPKIHYRGSNGQIMWREDWDKAMVVLHKPRQLYLAYLSIRLDFRDRDDDIGR